MDPMNTSPVMDTPKKGKGGIIAVIIIVLVVIIALAVSHRERENMMGGTGEDMNMPEFNSTSDDLDGIESDLNSVNFDSTTAVQ